MPCRPWKALSLVLILTACSAHHAYRVTVLPRLEPVSYDARYRGVPAATSRADVLAVERAAWLIAEARVESQDNGGHLGVRSIGSASVQLANPGSVEGGSIPPAASLASVLACIRAHESGNYAERSHPGSGSGAYQYVPGTWRTWSARAGYAGYGYAYEAPPAVQDAVTVFVLTHGGAGNWSPRYGNDPCTVGIGG